MKSQVNPIVVVIVLVVVVLGLGLYFWQGSQGVNTGSGKLQSNLGPIEKDPVKLQQGIEESLQRDKKRRGQ